jgi:hypothetical protein
MTHILLNVEIVVICQFLLTVLEQEYTSRFFLLRYCQDILRLKTKYLRYLRYFQKFRLHPSIRNLIRPDMANTIFPTGKCMSLVVPQSHFCEWVRNCCHKCRGEENWRWVATNSWQKQQQELSNVDHGWIIIFNFNPWETTKIIVFLIILQQKYWNSFNIYQNISVYTPAKLL